VFWVIWGIVKRAVVKSEWDKGNELEGIGEMGGFLGRPKVKKNILDVKRIHQWGY
jgi:hypothetical protein